MPALAGEAEGAVQQASRLIDFSERPEDPSQPPRGYDFVIEDEPGGKMVIRLALISPEGLFKVRPCARGIALETPSYAQKVGWAPPPRRFRRLLRAANANPGRPAHP